MLGFMWSDICWPGGGGAAGQPCWEVPVWLDDIASLKGMRWSIMWVEQRLERQRLAI